MIIINLATIDFGGGSGSSKPLITEPLIANVWSRGRRVFTPANYNVDGFSDVTINTAVIGENSALDFSLIGWDSTYSDDVNAIYNVDIEYSKSVLDKWNSGERRTFSDDTKLVYCPFVDTSNVTYMDSMFRGCSKLQIIPQLNTSNATTMDGMFQGCLLTTIPLLNTQNVTNMRNMFSNCSNLITIPQLNTSNVTDMYYIFNGCKVLTTLPLLNTQNVTNMNGMFNWCSLLTTIPQLNTQNVTNMNSMFGYCEKLQSLPLLDCGKVTNIGFMFSGFGNITTLTELGGFKDLKIDWNDSSGLAKLSNLTYQSIMNVLNNLYDFRANGDDTTTKTIKINSNTYNLLTADDIAMANGKGWVITK